MSAAPLTDVEKVNIRYHLGYPGAGRVASASGGIPVLRSPDFMVDLRLTQITDDGTLALLRMLLARCAEAEQKISCVSDELSAEQVGTIKLRGSQRGQRITDLHEAEHTRWAQRMADLLCVPLYPFAPRFNESGPGTMMRVRR